VSFLTLFFLAAVTLFPPPSVVPLEQAFLADSSELVGTLANTEGPVQLSLPEPLTVSGFASADQVRLIFKRIFSDFRTSEFHADHRLTTYPGKRGGIMRARWSFYDRRTGTGRVFRLYIYVTPVIVPRPRGTGGYELGLRIIEIRAEKT
jgi:hypothetical protein